MSEKKIPKVRVGNSWVDAHRVWNVVETITTATDLVEKFNESRPQLSTPISQEVVDVVRKRIRDMEIAMGGDGSLLAAAIAAGVTEVHTDPQKSGGLGDIDVGEVAGGDKGSNDILGLDDGRLLSDEDFAATAAQLLAAMSVDEALDMLQRDYDNPISPKALVSIVGEEVYLDSMKRQAEEFSANMIAPDQIAELWNESQLPSPVGGLWITSAVEQLLASH